MSNPNATIPHDIQPTRRRTRFMREEENNRILEYYKAGASHTQIRSFLNISTRQYWRRIRQIQLKDIELLQAKQTQESRAFLHERTLEKLKAYQQGAIAIATNKAYKPSDRIAAYHLARQLAIDEYSLEKFGVSSFIIPGLNDELLRGNRETARLLSEATDPRSIQQGPQEPLRIPQPPDPDTQPVF